MGLIAPQRLALGTCALGRAIDAHGVPLDRGPALRGRSVALELRLPRPNERIPIVLPLWTGVRAIDGLLTIGRGARVGIFGAPGTGKSTLIEEIVDGSASDAVVVALVGERGREAHHWIGRRNHGMTLVCATSDRPAHERVRAAQVAIAHARSLCERGLHVLLVLDSLARLAAGLREIAVCAGESVGRGGYPPSVFSDLARFIEVAGAFIDGSITLIATVLHDGDDRDPVSEASRALLDGHLALSVRRAERGLFPAIDVPASASRTMQAVAAQAHLHDARVVRRAIALLDRIEDARALGIENHDAGAVAAIAAEARIESFLRHECGQLTHAATLDELAAIARLLDENGAS
ncbi:MAG: EscN/YscN/HrcN family type III secretion system ATPase [Candidatus Eremiobacteraeota bacterium]|nr:EscN/YscN/HrcN family type III secretion system ATPase [Candidatus Eremiobacteraeota bacterium]